MPDFVQLAENKSKNDTHSGGPCLLYRSRHGGLRPVNGRAARGIRFSHLYVAKMISMCYTVLPRGREVARGKK